MSQSIAVVFPGQGSQTVGMMSALANQFPIVQQYFQTASALLSHDLWQIVETGPAETLNQTLYTQLVMLVSDVVMWHIWRQVNDITPVILAGHSLGEYAALVAAESMSFEDAVYLVAKRAQLMQDAVPEGKGGMAVMLGLSEEQIKVLCAEVSTENERVTAANFNAPGQIVIAGFSNVIDAAMSRAKEMGAKLVKKLPMSVPSHSYLMAPAAEKLSSFLSTVKITSPKIPVIHNVDVCFHHDPEEIRTALVQQLFHPVRWIETIQQMSQKGITAVIECGPGKVLTGLNKRINSDLKLIALSAVDGLKCADLLTRGE